MNAAAVGPTQSSAVDAKLARVNDASRTFARLGIDERIRLLDQMREGFARVAEASVLAACRAKGLDPSSPVAGEEWMGGPMVTARIMRLTSEALREVKRYGAPKVEPRQLRTLPDGRLSVQVLPHSPLDSVLLAKHTAEVHLQPGINAKNLKEHQARFYAQPHDGRVCLVLGAGNVNSIAPTDVVYKMFVEGKVCVLKMNPVNEYLGPFLEQAFASAAARGFFAVVYGGPEEGAYLVQHPLIDEVHITGSDKTFDTMVWGPPGPERESRKQRNDPVLQKPISSELGNISPVVVVPGPYEADTLAYQARSLAGMVANNASFNCNSAKLLVVPQEWPEREGFVRAVAKGLREVAPRRAYYPGAEDRFRQFTAGRPGVELIGNPSPGQLAYALLRNVDARALEDRVFTQEPWCSVLSETALPGADVPTYLKEVVRFLNENLWGTLCASLVVHPATMNDPRAAAAVEEAIRELKYGAVCVNTWPAAIFGVGVTPWGAHPSSTPQNIQSGNGWVHNTFMLEGIEKSVMLAPVKVFPPSPWLSGHRSLDSLMKKLVDFENEPSWLKVPGIAAAALRG